MIVALVGALCVACALLVGNERTLRLVRSELNQARAHEALLLTRLAARSNAEYVAVTERPTVDEPMVTVGWGPTRYLHDPTGLITVEVDEEVDA